MNFLKKVFILLIIIAAGLFVYKKFVLDKQISNNPPDRITIYGTIDIREIQLAFEASGRIKQLMVEEGDHVEKGKLLGLLDDTSYKADLQRLKAEVEAQQQVVVRMENGSRPQEIKAAKAKVEALKVKVHNALLNFKRIEKLARKKYVKSQALDDARALLKSLRAELNAAKQELALLVEGPRKEDINRAKALLSAKKSALQIAEKRLKDTKLYAPTEGIIENRILEPGSMAFPQTPVFTLALTNPLWARAYIPEPDLGKIRLGMKAVIKSDTFPEKSYDGWVGYISPIAEFTPKQVETTELRTKLVYQCRVFVCDDSGELRLGMPVTVEIPLNQKAEPAHQPICKALAGEKS